MKKIALSRGLAALVDDEDFDRLSRYRWYAHKSARGKMYAARKVSLGGARYGIEYMHHAVAGNPDDGVIDHENRDSLDNRRNNLVAKSQSANIVNSALGESKGIFFCKITGRYAARASLERRRVFLGRFDTEAEAVAAVREFRTKTGTRHSGLQKKTQVE